jgi:hypothetical protein
VSLRHATTNDVCDSQKVSTPEKGNVTVIKNHHRGLVMAPRLEYRRSLQFQGKKTKLLYHIYRTDQYKSTLQITFLDSVKCAQWSFLYSCSRNGYYCPSCQMSEKRVSTRQCTDKLGIMQCKNKQGTIQCNNLTTYILFTSCLVVAGFVAFRALYLMSIIQRLCIDL